MNKYTLGGMQNWEADACQNHLLLERTELDSPALRNEAFMKRIARSFLEHKAGIRRFEHLEEN
jgi:hypothetical protein